MLFGTRCCLTAGLCGPPPSCCCQFDKVVAAYNKHHKQWSAVFNRLLEGEEAGGLRCKSLQAMPRIHADLFCCDCPCVCSPQRIAEAPKRAASKEAQNQLSGDAGRVFFWGPAR